MNLQIRIRCLPRYVCGLTSLFFMTAPQVFADEFADKLQPFFEQHCLSCHGPDKEKGNLRVDQLSVGFDDHYSLDQFQNIIDELTTQSMPPEEEPQPDAQQVVEMMKIMSQHLETARERYSSGGGKPVRRLTRTEYVNTAWDLLGVRIPVEKLSDDETVGKFDTDATTLYMTDMHIQITLEAARDAVKRFIASRNEEPGVREIDVAYSPVLKNANYTFLANDVPPAGYLNIRMKWWKRDRNPGGQISIGPEFGEEVYDVTGTPRSPQIIDTNIYEPENTIQWKIFYSNIPNKKAPNPPEGRALAKYKITDETLVAAQSLVTQSPVILGELKYYQIISQQPYEFFKPFLSASNEASGELPDRAALGIIHKFVAIVNRGRAVDPEFVEKLNVVFQQGRQQGMSFWEALEEPLAISMCSIQSMLHFENRGTSKETRTISGVELANRLSYALWRSAPDTELLRLGQSGELLNPKVKSDQIVRMMNDERFDRFLSDFTEQWLELDRQDAIAVDTRIYDSFDYGVKQSMKEETIQFVWYLVRNNLPLSNFIDSDFMVINSALARHYGVPDVIGHEFRAVPIKPEYDERGGVVTHAGILMQTGTGDRTSIVERGAFVARKLLGDPPPPPPPNAGELPTDDVSTAKMTAAELVQHHASTPQCATCHNNIDPMGMALEEFDAIGQVRTVEKRINPALAHFGNRKRTPRNFILKIKLENEGNLPGGKTFVGAEGLKQALMENEQRFVENFIEALLYYANGREAGAADQAIVKDIVAKSAQRNYQATFVIWAVLASDAITTF
jgi:cytochrome c553